MEVWAKIDIESKLEYFISNYGNIYSLINGKKRSVGHKDVYGYLRVIINRKHYKIHRLVCEYFLENYNESLTVNHKDFNKSNNNINNLEMIDYSSNVMHYIINSKKEKTSSKTLGVFYHKTIKKWVSRGTINGKRYALGSFDSEIEAINKVKNFTKDDIIIGKGRRKGTSKYSQKDNEIAINLSYELGIRKAGKITGMGSTRISILRQ